MKTIFFNILFGSIRDHEMHYWLFLKENRRWLIITYVLFFLYVHRNNLVVKTSYLNFIWEEKWLCHTNLPLKISFFRVLFCLFLFLYIYGIETTRSWKVFHNVIFIWNKHIYICCHSYFQHYHSVGRISG